MNILGIDYGQRKIGLAFGDTESKMAQPLRVLRVGSEGEVAGKISRIVSELKVARIVVGVSEGKMAGNSTEFGAKLKRNLAIPVVFQDETLSSKEAQELSIKAGIGRKRRKKLEDAFSAALILQRYLDSENT